ncbi:MAG TPA: rhomboid family intramembrane serine protease [Parachlamydiaceae bacterium]|nr:rhomboid family intramembrane serine protease [Parachlamydiaceae bacterium]
MIPIGDDNSLRKSFPVVTYALIAMNVLFFFLEMSGGEEFVKQWAFIPSRFLSNPSGDFVTIFTSMFMHAGIGHLLGNMLYLWIFGDNIEDRMGKIPYLIFYLVCGIAATFSQLAFNPQSSIPNVGASGAIAGVLGAYILLFPGGKVKTMLGMQMVQIPALIVIGLWFVLQFVSGVGSAASTQGDEGGVAYMAHIGGFIAGLIITYFYRKTSPSQ